MSIGRHHQSLRRRLYKNLEPYPHPKRLTRMLDRLVFVIGFVSPFFTFPQLYSIYILHQVSGVSVVSWGAFAVFDIPWILYGFVHKERPIIFAYTLWLTVNTLVCIGALLY